MYNFKRSKKPTVRNLKDGKCIAKFKGITQYNSYKGKGRAVGINLFNWPYLRTKSTIDLNFEG